MINSLVEKIEELSDYTKRQWTIEIAYPPLVGRLLCYDPGNGKLKAFPYQDNSVLGLTHLGEEVYVITDWMEFATLKKEIANILANPPF